MGRHLRLWLFHMISRVLHLPPMPLLGKCHRNPEYFELAKLCKDDPIHSLYSFHRMECIGTDQNLGMWCLTWLVLSLASGLNRAIGFHASWDGKLKNSNCRGQIRVASQTELSLKIRLVLTDSYLQDFLLRVSLEIYADPKVLDAGARNPFLRSRATFSTGLIKF